MAPMLCESLTWPSPTSVFRGKRYCFTSWASAWIKRSLPARSCASDKLSRFVKSQIWSRVCSVTALDVPLTTFIIFEPLSTAINAVETVPPEEVGRRRAR